MTNLEDAVPPYEPAEDTLAFVTKAGLATVPIVGSIAAETLAHVLATRQAERQHAFDVLIAQELQGVLDRLGDMATVETIVDSDEFLAGVTRAQRIAAETSSETKRRRLAAAIVNGGSWAPFSTSEREQFTRLVDELGDLHVWLLHYFVDPKSWLDSHDLSSAYANIYAGGADIPLAAALGATDDSWRPAVTQAAADLDRAGLGSIPLNVMMTAQGVIDPRTSPKGRRFLEFLIEPDSAGAEPPLAL